MRTWSITALLLVGCGDRVGGPEVADAAQHDDGAMAPDGALVTGCVPRRTDLITDRDMHAEPALPARPAVGQTLVDPTFGTTIARITDASDCTSCSVAYSYYPSFNRESTRIKVSSGGGHALVYRFDPVTLAVSEREPLFTAAAPSGSLPFEEDALWSGTDPDVIYAHEGARLWAYNVATHVFMLVHDFGPQLVDEYLWQMSRSLDDDVFAFTRRQNTTYAVRGYVVWRRSTNTIVLDTSTTTLDEVQVDKSGRYLVVKTGQGGHGAIEVRVMDLTNNTVTDLIDDMPDFAPGHSDNGNGVVVGADNWTNRYTVRSLAQPHAVGSVLEMGNDWTQAGHVSFLAEDESHVLVSSYQSGAHTAGVLHDEIFAIATDGSQAVRRYAHHRSLIAGYDDMPRANISRDGCFVAFTSNWGGGRRDVFVVSLATTPN